MKYPFILLFFLLLPGAVTLYSESPAPYVYITGNNLNMRTSPSLRSRVITRLKAGVRVRALKRSPKYTYLEKLNFGAYWLKVRTRSGKEGWIFEGYTRNRLNMKSDGFVFLAQDFPLKPGARAELCLRREVSDGSFKRIRWMEGEELKHKANLERRLRNHNLVVLNLDGTRLAQLHNIRLPNHKDRYEDVSCNFTFMATVKVAYQAGRSFGKRLAHSSSFYVSPNPLYKRLRPGKLPGNFSKQAGMKVINQDCLWLNLYRDAQREILCGLTSPKKYKYNEDDEKRYTIYLGGLSGKTWTPLFLYRGEYPPPKMYDFMGVTDLNGDGVIELWLYVNVYESTELAVYSIFMNIALPSHQ